MNTGETVGCLQRSIKSEGSLLFMTFSRMAAFASSSHGEGEGRGTALGLRKAFQAKRRTNTRGREEMDITLRMEVCIHDIGTENEKKDEKQFDRKGILPDLNGGYPGPAPHQNDIGRGSFSVKFGCDRTNPISVTTNRIRWRSP